MRHSGEPLRAVRPSLREQNAHVLPEIALDQARSIRSDHTTRDQPQARLARSLAVTRALANIGHTRLSRVRANIGFSHRPRHPF
jgi:hypothetical protein